MVTAQGDSTRANVRLWGVCLARPQVNVSGRAGAPMSADVMQSFQAAAPASGHDFEQAYMGAVCPRHPGSRVKVRPALRRLPNPARFREVQTRLARFRSFIRTGVHLDRLDSKTCLPSDRAAVRGQKTVELAASRSASTCAAATAHPDLPPGRGTAPWRRAAPRPPGASRRSSRSSFCLDRSHLSFEQVLIYSPR